MGRRRAEGRPAARRARRAPGLGRARDRRAGAPRPPAPRRCDPPAARRGARATGVVAAHAGAGLGRGHHGGRPRGGGLARPGRPGGRRPPGLDADDRAAAGGVHPRPPRRVLRRAGTPGRRRPGRRAPRPHLGGEPRRWRPVRRQPGGAAARPLLRRARPGQRRPRRRGRPSTATWCSSTCAAGRRCRCRCRPPRSRCGDELGETRLDAVEQRGHRRAGDLVTARFAVGGTSYDVTVRQGRSEPARLTCRAGRDSAAYTFETVSIT